MILIGCKGGDSSKSSNSSASQAGYVEFSPEFPKPEFEGTPVPADGIPNLEPTGDPKKTFKAPEGTELVSVGKSVTSNDDFPFMGEIDMVTDGNKGGSDGNFVELGPGQKWVQIDLGQAKNIQAIILWHYHKAAIVYNDVVVQVSNDPEFKEGVATIYNNDYDDSAGMGTGEQNSYVETNHGRIIETGGVTGQYVRSYTQGNSANEMNHYVEIEVWATPAEEAEATTAE